MRIEFKTGRDYGRPQVLEIAYMAPGWLEPDDELALVPVTFRDEVRNISGRVRVFACQCVPARIGPAVLAEYDAGRYELT